MTLRVDQTDTTATLGNHAADHVATNVQVNQNTASIVISDAAVAANTAKLATVATGATANSTDSILLNRSNHTGSQLASTISDFSTAADIRANIKIAQALFNDLSDVVISSPTTGQVVVWNGSNWVNGSSASSSSNLAADQTFTGLNTFNQGIVLKDSAANLWLLVVNTDGSLQTNPYYSTSLSYALLTEDGLYYFSTEDSLNYLAQEA